jgi:hypothetical protein
VIISASGFPSSRVCVCGCAMAGCNLSRNLARCSGSTRPRSPSAPLALAAAFVGVMLAARDIGRYVVTEGCMTRLQLLWTSRAATASRAPTAPLGTPPRMSSVARER